MDRRRPRRSGRARQGRRRPRAGGRLDGRRPRGHALRHHLERPRGGGRRARAARRSAAIGGVIAVLQLARLLGRARAGEAALLRARGLDRANARRMAYSESALVVGSGAVVGWLGAVAVLATTGSALTAAFSATWPVLVGAFIVLGIVAGGAQLRRRRHGGGRCGRGRAAVTGSARSCSSWPPPCSSGSWPDSRGCRSPHRESLVADRDRRGAGAGPRGGSPPSLLLVFGPLAALIARVAARRPGLSPCTARTHDRAACHRLRRGGRPARAGLRWASFAGVALATWQAAAADTAVLVTGAQVRATVDSESHRGGRRRTDGGRTEGGCRGGGVHGRGRRRRRIAGSRRPGRRLRGDLLITAVPAAGVDPGRLAEGIADDAVLGAALGDSSGIRMTFAVAAGGGSRPAVPDVTALGGEAWFVDGLGTPTRVPLELAVAYDESTPSSGRSTPICPTAPSRPGGPAAPSPRRPSCPRAPATGASSASPSASRAPWVRRRRPSRPSNSRQGRSTPSRGLRVCRSSSATAPRRRR